MITVVAATEFFPPLNEWMQLVPIPSDFKTKLLTTMALDFSLSWVWETLCDRLFSDNRPRMELLEDD